MTRFSINSNRINLLNERNRMSKFLLLNPLCADDFSCTTEEMLEALEEFGCKYITSLDTKGQVRYYATASTKEALEQMCTNVELDGSVIEYSTVYDQAMIG